MPDIDGDKLPDLVISGRRPPAYSFCARSGNILGVYPRPELDDYWSITHAGGIRDIDGDGRGDVAIWAELPRPPKTPRRYAVDLFSGATGDRIRRLEQTGFDNVDSIPDLNADGVPELLFAAFGATPKGTPTGSGEIRIISGATGEQIGVYTSPHPTQYGGFGTALAVVEDADADGFPDILVGARWETPEGLPANSGAAYLISGATGAAIRSLASPRPLPDGWFGTSIASVPDANGDGRPEIAVGAPGEFFGRPGRQAYVFLSCRPDYNADSRLDSSDFFAFLGAFFADHADFNRDGRTNSQDFFDFLSEYFAGCQ